MYCVESGSVEVRMCIHERHVLQTRMYLNLSPLFLVLIFSVFFQIWLDIRVDMISCCVEFVLTFREITKEAKNNSQAPKRLGNIFC